MHAHVHFATHLCKYDADDPTYLTIKIVGGGLFRGIAASFRSMAGFKAGVRAIGQAFFLRTLSL